MIKVDKYGPREYAKCYGISLQKIWSVKGWRYSLKIEIGHYTWIVGVK